MPNIFDILWQSHEILRREDGMSLLFIDRHFVHEGSHHAFNQLTERGLMVKAPKQTFGVMDHYVPTRAIAPEASIAAMMDKLKANCAHHGIQLFEQGQKEQGIVHVIGPELGITQPGFMMVCGDSHTATHGAYGAFAFGIGASEVAHVLATQTLWQNKPKAMNISVEGSLSPFISAKDVILSIIAKIGADGAQGHAIEYSGSTIRALSMEGRLTLCNMSIEAGARSGLVAPDQKTYNALVDKPFSPSKDILEKRIKNLTLKNATYDAVHRFNAEEIAPTVTWGTAVEEALPVTANVPRADQYMGLKGGEALTSLTIDRVFIGSCTNSRIEDLRAAAHLLQGKKAKVQGLVSAGSMQVKAQAEREGLDVIFKQAGLEWVNSGCSMCVGMNGDLAHSGERVASTTNRNFKGRQGLGVRTHLMSPIMVAAAAITGKITDFRELL
jgi:3-isopropylmalate/(R)-2-methylmalate dehydratase large subunit